VKTPIDPDEELKASKRECLKTSGSYSIESLRNHQNGPLIFSKLESSGRILHNTNHLKLKGGRYPQKQKKFSTNICTVDIGNKNSHLGTLEKNNTLNSNSKTKFIDAKNTSCLSSPYLNKASDLYKNFNYDYEVKESKPSKLMNKTENSGFQKVKVSETTKTQIRNQMLDLDLIKLPSIGPEDAYVVQTENTLHKIGN